MSKIFGNNSSWGVSNENTDIRALRKFNNFLKIFVSFFENTNNILAMCIFVSVLLLMLDTNFTDLIFDDGTSDYCILNGKTGEIYYVSQK